MRLPADFLTAELAAVQVRPDSQPYRAMLLRYGEGQEVAEIAAAWEIEPESVRRYLRAAWKALFPEVTNNTQAREADQKAVRFLEAAVFRLSAPSDLAPYEEELTRHDWWLFILRECGALPFLRGSTPEACWREPVLPDAGPVYVGRR